MICIQASLNIGVNLGIFITDAQEALAFRCFIIWLFANSWIVMKKIQ